jgi:rsbT co-antagonist protein RsbR
MPYERRRKMESKNTLIEIAGVLKSRNSIICEEWRGRVTREAGRLTDIFSERELKKMINDFVDAVLNVIERDAIGKPEPDARIIDLLEFLSKEATINNISPSDTALFVFSLKDTLFDELPGSFTAEVLNKGILAINQLVDKMGLITFETYMRSREMVIKEQQKTLMDASIPVVKVWDKVLLLPLIGMIDSNRTQLMLEALLTGIEETQSKVAILDISGIPLVDSLVARHLIMTVSAARLMGAECIITGISSRISQTMVSLGVDLTGIITRGVLADGLKLAFELSGQSMPSERD